MARRSDHTKEELKEMAVCAGQEIISMQGFNSFSARKVAKKIGYTVGTIYNIFDSHDDLILHINASTLDDMYDFIVGSIDKSHKGVVSIKGLAALYLEFAQGNYNIWSALFEFNLPQNTLIPNWYSEKIESLFVVVECSLDGLEDSRLHAKTLWASIHGICYLGLTGKLDAVGADSVKVLTDSLIDNYLLGVGKGSDKNE